MLPRQARFALTLCVDLKGLGRMGEKLVAPWLILGLADLLLGANCRHRLALQALNDEHRVGLGIPLPSLHG
jgi:hypothetical protein